MFLSVLSEADIRF